MVTTKKHTNTLLEEKDLYLAMSSTFDGWNYKLVHYLPNGNRLVIVDGFKDVKEVRRYLLK